MDPRLPDIARATVAEHQMLPAGSVVLAMVSGGADSTSLLRLLAAGELDADLDVSVLHVNHLLRGVDADSDAEFVVALCEDLGVPCRVVRYDVSAFATSEGLNLEDAGRRVRYRFAAEELEALLASREAPGEGRIATAHTLDDRAETFLMRLASGSGPGGLAAIPAVRGRIVRPLIGARRSEVTAYLEALGQPWREDATNADTTLIRARVRHEIMPALLTLNPSFPDALERTMAILSDEDAMLDAMAEGFVDAFAELRPGEVSFQRENVATLASAMSRRVVRLALTRAFPEASRLEFEHVEALADGMIAESFARDLPGGLRACTEYARMTVARRPDEPGAVAPSLLEIPGVADLGEAGRMLAQPSDPSTSGDPFSVVIDSGLLTEPLLVDGMRPGDRIRPLGMAGTKKVSDLLTDEKVPHARRALTPIVRHARDVVWVAGVRLSEDYRVTPGTTQAARIVWQSSEGA